MMGAATWWRYAAANSWPSGGFGNLPLRLVLLVALTMALRTYSLIADPYAPLGSGSRPSGSHGSGLQIIADCQKGFLTC